MFSTHVWSFPTHCSKSICETLQLFALITQARAGDLKLMDLAEGKGPTVGLTVSCLLEEDGDKVTVELKYLRKNDEYLEFGWSKPSQWMVATQRFVCYFHLEKLGR